MTDIILSTSAIILAYAWYLAARSFPCIPKGPRLLRGAIGACLVWYAANAVVAYAHDSSITSWNSAFVNVTIVILHLCIALLVAFLLWTMESTYIIRFSLREEENDDKAS